MSLQGFLCPVDQALPSILAAMVIKDDCDLTMTIFAHNHYRLLARYLDGFESATTQTLYKKFIRNEGTVTVDPENITLSLKKKQNLPAILPAVNKLLPLFSSWLQVVPLPSMRLLALNFLWARFYREDR